MKRITLSLGSNLGNRQQHLAAARNLIEAEVGKICRQSSILETESWGFSSFKFLNQIIVIESTHPPLEMLEKLQGIEKQLGRETKSRHTVSGSRYVDRIIDIDILLYEGVEMQSEQLTIPHPRMHERDFIKLHLQELDLEL